MIKKKNLTLINLGLKIYRKKVNKLIKNNQNYI